MARSSDETEDLEPGERRVRLPVWMFNGVGERLDPEILRLVGRVRQWAALAFIAITILTSLYARELQLRQPFYWYYAVADIAFMALVGILGRLLWKRTWSARRLAQINVVCLIAECIAILLEVWAYGSSTAPMLGVAALWVVMYRLTLDTRTGLLALGSMLLGQWGIVAAELLGAIPSHPAIEATSVSEVAPARQVAALAPFTIMLFAGFFLAHWTKLRLVDRERTLRVLRRALAHGYPGEIGPETGRLLAGVFAVGPRLGRGGMGEVYEATDTRSRERVAIKMLHPHLATQPRSLRRFRREAAILQGLGSQHIVRIISVEHDESHPFNVLELLVGETLKARIERAGALPDASVARLARQLAAALDVAHEHGVVHRDLNPSNVFLCGSPDDFTVKVFDFSISKRADDEAGMTVDGALLGTPAYMAPEQAAGRPDDVTPRTDIYAMGLVLFPALTGRAPFEASSLPSLLERIRSDAMLSVSPIRPDLDPSVDAVLSRATSKSPEARHATAGELATALVAALGPEAA